jgi:hypothetical protein
VALKSYQPMVHATLGQFYSKSLVDSVSGGTPPYRYQSDTLAAGWPPLGMVVTPEGRLTGTPRAEGENRFNLCAIDGGNGAPACTPVSIEVVSADAPPLLAKPLKIRVAGNHFVDASGAVLQLRGVNVSGLESVPVQGWSPNNPWGGVTGDPTPNWNTIKKWQANAVRIPLNEASWLGYQCIDGAGAARDPDPGHDYQATVKRSVAGATAAGLYVILDLHWTAPGKACPTTQNAMADLDHSLEFWTSLANGFKGYPNVLFELFNEPFLDKDKSSLVDDNPWPDLLNGGGTLKSYQVNGHPDVIPHTWHNAGMQQMLDAVRATGATNVILTGTLYYSSDMGGWLTYKPADPLRQLGAVWHSYPSKLFANQTNCHGIPFCSPRVMSAVKDIVAAGYPVVITEFGDAITADPGESAPWASVLLPFADANGMSYFAWSWNTYSGFKENVLILDAAGDPTNGYGRYVRQHYLCVAAAAAKCP